MTEQDLIQAGKGVVAAFSTWNFPALLASRKIAPALAAGCAVIVTPAEETPLIAALAIGLLHEAGVPRSALQLLPGDGEVGGRLIGNPTNGLTSSLTPSPSVLRGRGLG